jgi:hypothetical protein
MMKRFMPTVVEAFLLLALVALVAWAWTLPAGAATLTVTDKAAEVTIGHDAAGAAIKGVPVYVKLDARGMSPANVSKLRAAMAGKLEKKPTKLAVAVSLVASWNAAPDGSALWSAYVVLPLDAVVKVKDGRSSGALSYRLRWTQVQKDPDCALMFSAATCVKKNPPFVYAGVAP